jgi:hypothetical protein
VYAEPVILQVTHVKLSTCPVIFVRNHLRAASALHRTAYLAPIAAARQSVAKTEMGRADVKVLVVVKKR